jgi:hypothetical protein
VSNTGDDYLLWSHSISAEYHAQCYDGIGIGTKMIFLGQPSKVASIYDYVTDTWTTSTLPSLARGGRSAASISPLGVAFWGGGLPDGMLPYPIYSAIVDVYNVNTDQWSILPTGLSRGRYWGTATSVGTYVIFAGGIGQDVSHGNELLSNVEVFNAATMTWVSQSYVLPNNQPRYALASTSYGTRAYFAGGSINQGADLLDRVEVFETATMSWLTSLTLPGGKRTTVMAVTLESTVIFIGGNDGVESRAVDMYSTSIGTWSTHQMTVPRDRTSALVVGGLLVIAGGTAAWPSQRLSSIEVYDPLNKTWSYTDNVLSEARMDICSASNGQVAVFIGGINSPTWSKSNATDVVTGMTLSTTHSILIFCF